MTIKEKKEFLKSYKHINSEIDRLLSERKRYYNLATKITTTYSDTKTAHSNNSKIETAIEKITQLENEINKKIDELISKKQEINDSISTINDKALQELLKRRYINCQTWEQIAVEMHYSWQHIHKLHAKSLNAIVCDIIMC